MLKENGKKQIATIMFSMLFLGAGVCVFLLMNREQSLHLGISDKNKAYDAYYVLIEEGHDSILWDSVYDGARREGEEHCDAYVEYFGKNLTTEYTLQDKLRIAIDAGVDGIILNGDGAETTEELVREAVEKGIPVVTALDDSAYSLRKCFVGVNNYNLGQEYSRLVWELLSQKEKNSRIAVLMNSDSMDTGKNTMFLGLREALDEIVREMNWEYEVELQAVAIDSANAFMTEETIRNILVNEEMQPDILICLSEIDTRRVYEAVVDYIKVGEISILGYYESQSILDAIEKEIIYATIAVDGAQLGSFCVQALKEYRETGYVNGYFPVDIYVIGYGNVSQYLEQYQEQGL